MGYFPNQGTMGPQSLLQHSYHQNLQCPISSTVYIKTLMYGLQTADNFGFTLPVWNLEKYLDIDGTVLSGNSTVLTQDL